MTALSKHARLRLNPSSAHRWLHCSASPSFIVQNADRLPEDDSTEWSREGTEAHKVAEALMMGSDPGSPAPAMLQHARGYVSFAKDKLRAALGGKMYVEQKVPLYYMPDSNGMIDCAIASRDLRSIYIIDYKYGAGVGVDARDNPQLAIYAESFIRWLEVLNDVPQDALITIAVYQPRARDGQVEKIWALLRSELALIASEIEGRAQVILDAKNPVEFVVEPEGCCRFCPAKGICDAYARAVLGVERIDEPSFELPNPDTYPRDKRVAALAMRSGIEKWFDALEKQEMHDLTTGAPRMGWKLVEGRSNRTWVDEAAAKQLLSNHLKTDQIYPPGDIISPAQAEVALKGFDLSTKFENKFAALIIKAKGKPTLAPESDKRPALSSAASELQDLDII
jgi:hypothetical protein